MISWTWRLVTSVSRVTRTLTRWSRTEALWLTWPRRSKKGRHTWARRSTFSPYQSFSSLSYRASFPSRKRERRSTSTSCSLMAATTLTGPKSTDIHWARSSKTSSSGYSRTRVPIDPQSKKSGRTRGWTTEIMTKSRLVGKCWLSYQGESSRKQNVHKLKPKKRRPNKLQAEATQCKTRPELAPVAQRCSGEHSCSPTRRYERVTNLWTKEVKRSNLLSFH